MPGTHHEGHSHGLGWHVHRGNKEIDTKSKIIILLVNTFILTLLISFELLLLFTILLVLLTLSYKANVMGIIKKFLITIPLLFSLTFLAYLAYPNHGVLTLGKTAIVYSKIELMVFYFLKTFLFIYNSLLLIESEDSFLDVIYAFDSLKMPKILVNVLLFMYRSTLDLQEEAIRMIDVRYIRSYGKRLGSNLHSYLLIGYMIGGIITRAFIRNNQRKEALIARGYEGTLHHAPIQWKFQGLRLLWITLLCDVILLFLVQLKFLPFGVFLHHV